MPNAANLSPENRLISIGGSPSRRLLVELDEEDIHRVLMYPWQLQDNRGESIVSTIWGRTYTLPRFILKYEGSLTIDHIDRDIFNNKKINFRFATQSEQNVNQAPRNGRKYRGITFRKCIGKWHARVYKNGIYHLLGNFDTEEAAARAYDKKAKQLYGNFVNLNFPEKEQK